MNERNLQKKKHFDPRISTFFGIKIDSRDEDENASDSIRVNREFDSNEMHRSCRHCLRTTIAFGIQTRRISPTFDVESETVSIEPFRTTIRGW
jgi:hypothetical protein